MDVRALMAQSVRCNRERPAIVHKDRRLSFGEAWERGVRLANALLGLGLEPGDRVAVLEDNCIEAADIFQACAIANLVRVPLYARNSTDAHQHMMSHTNCRCVVVSPQYAAEIMDIRAALPDLAHVVVRDESYEPWLAAQSAQEPDVAIAPDDFFIIRHTAGTTGKAKAVAYSHRSWLAAVRDWFYIFPQVVQGDKCLHIGPISHASGYQYLPIWLAGGCNVMMDRFDIDEMLDIIERERIAYAQMVATMLRAMVMHPTADKRDFSSLKCVLIGAAPIQESTALAGRALLGDILYQGYGQTEVLPIAFMGPQQWFATVEGSSPLRACGMVMPFSLVEIRDEDGNALPLGEIGEIVARSDGQMTRFWNAPDATADRMEDGWIKTGDIGRIDANGYVYLLDRADDMIISGGYNIWPSEIENAITRHPDIIEVAAFGVPHERWGETPVAQCVIRAGSKITEEDLIALVAEELGGYKKPSRIVLQTEPLPRSPVGKIQRKKLREPYWRGVERRISGG
ncbi:MAG: class I adenylate-forming enzyme family protein [Hyphomonadaceae bacterium]